MLVDRNIPRLRKRFGDVVLKFTGSWNGHVPFLELERSRHLGFEGFWLLKADRLG